MKDLNCLRKEIDAVDKELLSLIEKRFEITEQIGEYKAKTGKELFCPEREEEKIENLKKAFDRCENSGYIEEMLRSLMNCSKYQQSNNMYGTKDIFLIGMPGCGKSTIGKILSEKMQREYIDMDKLFCFVYGFSPAECIEKEGENEFRRMESVLLKNISKRQDFFRSESCYSHKSKKSQRSRVISCGGGIVVRDENKGILKSNSLVIYIKRDLDKLAKNGRPLTLKNGVHELFAQRKDKYESWSDITIENDKSIETTVNDILDSLIKSEES